MKSVKTMTGFFISFLIGSAIGGGIALLYAPESGKRLRKDIGRKSNELLDEGKKMASDTWNDAKEKAESTLDSANDFLNANIEKITRKTEKVKDALKSGVDAYNEELKHENNLVLEDAENTRRQRR